MKIATWNVNSVRARLERLLAWLVAAQPDVLCLQELKCTDEQFPLAAVEAAGYRAVTFGQKTYNGVALLSREPLDEVTRNLGDGDAQARAVAGTLRGVRVVCVYAPNGQAVDSPAYQYKLAWYGTLARTLAAQRGRPLVLCGDLNVAPADADVHDPALWAGQTLCTARERDALAAVVTSAGLVDVFRAQHPEPGRYSWWDYRAGAFPKDRGLRIDHIFATAPLAARCTAADIDREARKGPQPSDHAPVWAVFADE